MIQLSKVLQELNITDAQCFNERSFKTMSYMIDNHYGEDCAVFLGKENFLKKINDSVCMVITTSDLKDKVLELGKGVCVCDDPRLLFYRVHNYLAKTSEEYIGKKWATKIGKECKISDSATIADCNVQIGNNVIIGNHVDILENTIIGDNVIIRSGAAIGNPGYDFKEIDGKLTHTEQVGYIELEDDVEIGANTCIEKSTFSHERTLIKKESKVGSQVYIAHGVILGERTMIPNKASISGYTTVGNNVSVGPGAIVSNLLSIGDEANITIGSVVAQKVKSGEHVAGNFAVEYDKFMINHLEKQKGRREG